MQDIGRMIEVRPESERELNALRRGEALILAPEGAALAIAEAGSGTPLGWVPEVLLGFAHAVLRAGGHRLSVLRSNDRDLPAYQRLLVRLEGTVPGGFEAFPGDRWLPAV